MESLRSWARSIAPALVAALVLLGGGACARARIYPDPTGPAYSGSFAPDQEAGEGEPAALRIVTFNVEYALRVDRALAALREHPALAGADLVALQEMDAAGTEAVARGLRLNYAYFPASVHPKHLRDVGNAVLTPWPIVRSYKLPLPHLSRGLGQARLATVAVVRVMGREIRAYSLHLGSPLGASPGQRREQLEVVTRDAAGAGEPVVVAGDFNSASIGERMAAAGYDWITRGVGPSTKHLSYDHVFVKGLVSARTRAGVARDVREASDHRPVWALLLGPRWAELDPRAASETRSPVAPPPDR
jgi:endonuclease/exonuclease/phosphatase family metal-dependent hydrolase